ncbi:MAG: hypothetical protein FJY97_11510 [candidate division Zixibacteria bacterium]|nr:hypothetical protein [candidate division Zixibacteria bacterium]
MGQTSISGEESIAYGAVAAGAAVIASYPGSPGSTAVQKLFSLADAYGLHVEWSTNEKVAFETAAGASIGGVRALMACKGVGFNVALDPIMVANLTDVGAGLVVVLGDDPGAWASQNDQDTRPIVYGTELPMLEPTTPAEGLAAMGEAFRLSDEFQMPVVVRITKSFGAMRQTVDLPMIRPAERPTGRSFPREPMRWISVPGNAVALHRRQHERLEKLATRFESSPFNQIVGNGRLGIVAAGFAHTKLMEVLEGAETADFSIFLLSTLYPLPVGRLTAFLETVDRALVLEENEPFIEKLLKAAAFEARVYAPIEGKRNGLVPREGELFCWQIAETLRCFSPGFRLAGTWGPEAEKKYMPSLSGLPENCPYTPVFETLRRIAEEMDVRPVYVVDPGCAIKINTPSFEMLDIKYSMGSSIGLASGLIHAGISDPVVAVVGDSDFFHLAVNALFNVAHQGSNLLVLVLDNATTALSGFQPAPGLGETDGTGALRIEEIAAACPVSMVETVDPWRTLETEEALRRGLSGVGIRVVIARHPCPYIEARHCPGYRPASAPVEVEQAEP